LATYLRDDSDYTVEEISQLHLKKRYGQIFFGFGFIVPVSGLLFGEGSKDGTYMRLISSWAAPVLLFLWCLSYQPLITLPRTNVSLAVTLPTLYFWIVNTVALRGTWSISSDTKLGIEIWPGLEIEEAAFFLVSNMLVVFGSTAFDNAIAILDTFPSLFPNPPPFPPLELLIQALLTSTTSYSTPRLTGLNNAVTMARKSRSFTIASTVFCGRLRIDLILLYAFYRISGDLVDNATAPEDAEKWIKHLSQFLKIFCSTKKTQSQLDAALSPFPPEAKTVLALLPVDKLPSQPLYTLLDGLRTHVSFLRSNSTPKNTQPPIQTEVDLETYASRVASTLAELSLSLIYAHDPDPTPATETNRAHCITASKQIGLVLQYIHIVRDVAIDAQSDRCYIPVTWLSATSPDTFREEILTSRKRILDLAFQLYHDNRGAIELLPPYARNGIRAAVESYVEIGREMRRKMARGVDVDVDVGRTGHATVPMWRRVWVGWWSMSGWGRGGLDSMATAEKERRNAKN
jgi:15-cis-phytoene synthase / lycopene beta-cyclase